MADQGEYIVVNSISERAGVFKDLVTQRVPIMGVAEIDNIVFGFKPLRLENELLYISPEQHQRTLGPNEALSLVFGLSSGQYVFKSAIIQKSATLFAAKTAAELRRLQRRATFRAVVTSSFPLTFLVQSGIPAPHSFPVLDISAGGLGLSVPIKAPRLQPGMKLDGLLKFPDQDDLAVHGEVKHIYPPSVDGAYKAGFEFRGLSPSEQQALFVVSLKIHRQTAANFLK